MIKLKTFYNDFKLCHLYSAQILLRLDIQNVVYRYFMFNSTDYVCIKFNQLKISNFYSNRKVNK